MKKWVVAKKAPHVYRHSQRPLTNLERGVLVGRFHALGRLYQNNEHQVDVRKVCRVRGHLVASGLH